MNYKNILCQYFLFWFWFPWVIQAFRKLAGVLDSGSQAHWCLWHRGRGVKPLGVFDTGESSSLVSLTPGVKLLGVFDTGESSSLVSGTGESSSLVSGTEESSSLVPKTSEGVNRKMSVKALRRLDTMKLDSPLSKRDRGVFGNFE